MLAILTTTVLAAGALTGVPAAHATVPSPQVVTLITGDRVTLTGGAVRVQPGPGREHITFLHEKADGERHVIPSDALPLLGSGTVDRRLFDVTALAEAGGDPPARTGGDQLGLLIAGNRERTLRATRMAGARVTRDLPGAGLLAVRVDRAARPAFWKSLTADPRPGIARVWLDGRRKLFLDHSVPQIGAPAAWQAGYDGTGVTVAVLDGGVDTTHPDLVGQVTAAENFTDAPTAEDDTGHGTHIASTIAGTGAASGGRYRGVAPGATLLSGKVCLGGWCPDSAILAGMEWAAARGASVVNMSFGGDDTPEIDPVERAVNDLTARYGTLFVAAVGNAGTISPPGSPSTADAALAVGAVGPDDRVTGFSSRGPRVDGAVKPEITAPGAGIVAAKAANVPADPAQPGGYVASTGTSMAAPHVAGAAAILAQVHPEWTPARRKSALMASAVRDPEATPFEQGAGRVDVARAINQTVTTVEGGVSFGRQSWPHDDDQAVTKAVTYRNDGPAPVTLTLRIDSPAAAGTFTAGAGTLTVPAGGTAGTTLTANPVGQPDGLLGGYLVATADGGVRVETPFGLDREVESYDITLVNTGRDGTPSGEHLTVLSNPATGAEKWTFNPTDTVRVPKGEYVLRSGLFTGNLTEDPADDTVTLLVQEKLVVDSARTIAVDARLGRTIAVTVPDPAAAPAVHTVRYGWSTSSHEFESAWERRSAPDGTFVGRIGSSPPRDDFRATVTVTFARKGPDGTFRNSPVIYDVAWQRRGTFFDGFRRDVRARELATLHASYGAAVPGTEGVKVNMPAGLTPGPEIVGVPFDLPFRRTEHVNVEPGQSWTAWFGDGISQASSAPAALRAGRAYPQEWNRPVSGPSGRASRAGDVITADLSMFSDSSGHPAYTTMDRARISLSSGGAEIGSADSTSGQFTVPPGVRRYRLDAGASRSAPLSTSVHGTWTFRSGHAGDGGEPLPLLTARIHPALDDRNAAPADRSFAVPVTTSVPARSVRVEVSYDDGVTWRPVPVRGTGAERVATVRHPAAAGYASLRVHAEDHSGDTVTQTVVRAYAIAAP